MYYDQSQIAQKLKNSNCDKTQNTNGNKVQ